ncbi:hypothetical protein HDC90_001799 [Pedobacter sp. AK013]|nr:hypothetical protein [Pedobacter sp. AK013]
MGFIFYTISTANSKLRTANYYPFNAAAPLTISVNSVVIAA